MWKAQFKGVLWLLVVFLFHGTRGGPCCKDGGDFYLERFSVKCVSTNEIVEIYSHCDSFFIAQPHHEINFHEDEDKKLYTYDNITWHSGYCTGWVVNTSDPNNRTFSAITCFENEVARHSEHILYAICQLISILFIISTLIVYLMLPELRDLQGKCIMCFMGSLAIGYSSLAVLQVPVLQPESSNECIIFAFFMYFWLLSSFSWLNINSFNMWRSAVLAHVEVAEKKLFMFYLLAGWGIPLFFLAVAITTHNMPGDIIKPNFGIDKCWFQGNVESWSFFYGPVAVLLVLNILYFLSTALHLWSVYKDPNPITRIKSLRVKFGLYLKLFLTMGLIWIFEVISFAFPGGFFWVFTDVLNCLQGVIIFMVMIATRPRVWRALARRKPCGLTCNRHWQSIQDDETENPIIGDEQ